MVRPLTRPIPFIMPCLNRFDMFTETVETIDTPIIPIIIDCWRNNRGVSGAWNEGMKRALAMGERYAVISNDDLKYTPGSLYGIFETLIDSGVSMVSANQLRLPKRDSQYVQQGVRVGADMFCFAVDIEQLTEVAGWFDENFFPAYFEDNDMHRRMMISGLESYINTDHIVIHEGSMTQKFNRHDPNVPTERFEAHRGYFMRKWGGNPEEATFQTPFNEPGLTVRDWYDSMMLDGLETSPAQDILDSIDSKCYNTMYEQY